MLQLDLLENLLVCDEGLTSGTFDFSSYEELVKTNPNDTITFHESNENGSSAINPITNISNYTAQSTPKEIFVRVDNQNCYILVPFTLITKKCPPTVYNFMSANNDSINDTFTFGGLRDVFVDFELKQYQEI